MARHNDDTHGHWLILDAYVYDVSELMRTHPGGARILQLYAGRDATHGFRRVGHDQARVQRLLAQTRIGTLCELECTTQADHAAHGAAARALQRALALALEMQNALRVDHGFQLSPLRSGAELSAPVQLSRYELQRGLDTHARFHSEYVDALTAVSLADLASIVLTPEAHSAWRTQLEQLQSSAACTDARASVLRLMERMDAFTDHELTMIVACCEVLDSWLLRVWKGELLRALRALECPHPAALRPSEAPRVYSVCDRLCERLGEYFRHAAAITQAGPRSLQDP